MMAACGGAGGGVGDDGDDDGDPMVDGGQDTPDGPPQPDAPEVCVPSGNEVYGDGVDNDCDGIVDELRVCGDGSEPFTTIGAAVAAAPDGGGVEVCAGVYAERLDISNKSIRINGVGAETTILDAGGGLGIAVSGGHELIISGMTIRGGRGTTEGGAIRCHASRLKVLDGAILDNRAVAGGGGIYGLDCVVGIERTRFENNEGHDRGGAVLLQASTGAITGSVFTGNSADYGGAVALVEGTVAIRMTTMTTNEARIRGGAIYQMSDGVVEDSFINGNYAGWTGGGVHVNQHAPAFRRSHFNNNEAAWEGGAFYLHQAAAVLEDNLIDSNTSFDDGGALRIFESPARLERNMISNNHSVDGDGGAFKCSHVAARFIDNMLINNEALGAGGGAEFDNDSSHWSGGLVSGNRSSIGGGMHLMLWPWNGGIIEDVAILGNDAHRGGGIYIENNYQPVTIRRILVDGNEAHQAAGVYTRGTKLKLTNSTITNNEAGDVGGGFFVHPSSQYPWTKPCPCPPIDPPAEVAFTVFHGNIADNGAAAWFGAPNLTFRNNILANHATSSVMVADLVPSPYWSHNDTHPATFMGMSNPTGNNGNLSSDPVFTAAGSGDFHLAAGSVCIDAAEPGMTDHDGSRADLGAYGGPDAP